MKTSFEDYKPNYKFAPCQFKGKECTNKTYLGKCKETCETFLEYKDLRDKYLNSAQTNRYESMRTRQTYTNLKRRA